MLKRFDLSARYLSSGVSSIPIGAFFLGLLGTAVFMTAPIQASAQEREGNAVAQCMSKELADSVPLEIIVPANNTAAMRAAGFAPRQCGRSFASSTGLSDYRDRVCRYASAWEPRVYRIFERRSGVSIAELCGMAEVVVGQWDRTGGVD